MDNKKIIIAARILLLLYIGAVCALCFLPSEDLPNIEWTLWGLEKDKIAHFLMFLPFPLLAYFAWGRFTRSKSITLILSLIVFATGLIFAAGTEYIQGQLGYRSMDVKDLIADALALALSSLCILLYSIFRRT